MTKTATGTTGGKAATKKAPAKAEPAMDPKTGIDLSRVKADVVDHYLGELGLEVKGPIGDRLARLAGHLGEKVEKKKKVKCDCGGVSDARLTRCPYCGDEEADEQALAAGKAGEQDALEELRVPKAGKAAKKAPPAAPPAPPPSQPVIEAHGEVVEEGDAPDSGPAPNAAALAVLGDASGIDIPATATEADLDAAVVRVRGLYSSAVGNVYDLGTELRRLFAGKLYLQRRDTGGKPVHESWTSFVGTELAGVCTVQYSYTLMAVVRQYTREKVLEHGPKKLNLLLRVADPDLRAELEEELPGLSTKALQAKVTSAAGAGASRAPTQGGSGFAGTPNREGRPAAPPSDPPLAPPSHLEEDPLDPGIENDGLDRPGLREPKGGAKKASTDPLDVPDGAKGRPPAPAAAGPAPTKAPAAPPANPGVATTFLVGRTKVPLFARPKSKTADPKRAKKLADDPHGELELPNGVRLTFKLLPNRKGELEIVLDVAKEG